VNAERHVRPFRNGRSQAVRIPREFELPGAEAIVRKEGDRLISKQRPENRCLRFWRQ
jgi:antitoxin VapB